MIEPGSQGEGKKKHGTGSMLIYLWLSGCMEVKAWPNRCPKVKMTAEQVQK